MSDLAAWLLEQIAEDERKAHINTARVVVAQFDARVVPLVRLMLDYYTARVLAECDAKRRIIDAHLAKPRRGERITPYPRDLVAEQTLRLLASVYADRPGYDESWRP